MAKLMELEVLSPSRTLVSKDDVVYVLFDTITGGIGVLANHAPLLAALKEGPLKIQGAGGAITLLIWKAVLQRLKITK